MPPADESGPKTRLKRTRTGCFKCRVRRRKCDEGKPRCQRCLDGGFDCQYGTKLSFLDKNAFTSSSSGPSKPSKSYSTLRFVGTPLSKSPVDSSKESSGQGEAIEETSSITQETSNSQFDTSQTEGAVLSDFQPSPPPPHPPHEDLRTPGTFVAEASPSHAAYETALNVLLNMGTGNEAPVGSTHPTPNPQQRGSSNYFAVSLQDPGLATPGPTAPVAEITEQFSTCALLPQDRSVQLLRHYRYNVAPWLDIGDPAQTFGLEVPRLAMQSPSLLESLLSLSMTSLNRYADADLKALLPPHNDAQDISLLESVVIIAFAGVRQFAATTPQEWQSPFASIGLQSLDSALADGEYFSVRLAVSWILLRLDIGNGLLNSSPVSIPSLLPYGLNSSLVSELSRDTLGYNRQPLLLCAEVLNHCFGNDSDTHLGMGTTHKWKILSEALIAWYNKRPNESKPMMELDDNEQLFPLILFSSGAVTLANQMFHTAMLLLLQNRPRTLMHEHGRSMTMSPLWHAQRICGISLNNDSRKSWDFSLVGSLYIGAKRMTYEPQQHAILAGIDHISGITGWDLSSLSTRLLQEWQPD